MTTTPEAPARPRLQPCPFCGHAAQLCSADETWFVLCLGCAAKTATYSGPGDADAGPVAAWNRRTALEAPPVAEEQAASVRAAFEAWVKSPPYERLAERLPDDPDQTAWPGQYRCPDLQLAWESWQAAAAVDGGQADA